MRPSGPSPRPMAPSWRRFVPGIERMKSYRAAWLPSDLAAGITLGVVMIPVGLAFGELASPSPPAARAR